jgi:dTDP-4-dehydrorhamnose 3,5-epimerase
MEKYLKNSNSSLIDGVMIKALERHKDERGFFEEIIRVNDPFFTEGFAQLSHSLMHNNVIKAWHIHKTQVDWWYVTRGTLKVALYDTREHSPTHKTLNEFHIGDFGDNLVIKIPSGVAHGCKVLGDTAELVYITSGTYNPDEEGRIAHDDPEIGYDWLKLPPIK